MWMEDRIYKRQHLFALKYEKGQRSEVLACCWDIGPMIGNDRDASEDKQRHPH